MLAREARQELLRPLPHEAPAQVAEDYDAVMMRPHAARRCGAASLNGSGGGLHCRAIGAVSVGMGLRSFGFGLRNDHPRRERVAIDGKGRGGRNFGVRAAISISVAIPVTGAVTISVSIVPVTIMSSAGDAGI